MRADVVAGGVRSASAVVIVGAGGDVRSRSNSASRPSTRDFFRSATSAAKESILLLSELMASSSSSFVADSRRRRRVQLCVAVSCSGRRLRGAKLWATASSAMHSVPCIVRAVRSIYALLASCIRSFAACQPRRCRPRQAKIAAVLIRTG